MKLTIPAIGTYLKLTKPWKFKLHREYRNDPLRKALSMPAQGYRGDGDKSDDITLPKGTVLVIDRMYLRKGAEEFDSLTFRLHECPGKVRGKAVKGKPRFWAKLADVNQIQCDVDPATCPGRSGASIIGLGESRRYGDQATFAKGERVIVRGASKVGVGVVVTAGSSPVVALPSNIKGCEPVFTKGGFGIDHDQSSNKGFIVYGRKAYRANDVKPATAEEIAADKAKLAKLQSRREKGAQADLDYLKHLYANPLHGKPLEIVQSRNDRNMVRRFYEGLAAFGGGRTYHEVDQSSEAFHKLLRESSGELLDLINIAVAQNPDKHPWGHTRQDQLCTDPEHRVVAAVQQGHLTPSQAFAVLPERVRHFVRHEAFKPIWDGAGEPV
jgi:hypothetical protein